MKTIKIFLASSSELHPERVAVGNLVRQINKEWENQSLRRKLDLEKFERFETVELKIRKEIGHLLAAAPLDDDFKAILRKKLDYFRRELAVTADPSLQFELKKRIQDIEDQLNPTS